MDTGGLISLQETGNTGLQIIVTPSYISLLDNSQSLQVKGRSKAMPGFCTESTPAWLVKLAKDGNNSYYSS